MVCEAVGALCGGETGPVFGEGFGGDLAQVLLEGGGVAHWREEVEGGVADDIVEQRSRTVFLVRENEGMAGWRFHDGRGHVEKPGRALGNGLGRRADGEGQRLAGVGVEAEERLDGFDGVFVLMVTVPPGLAFGIAAHVVGVDGQQVSGIVSAGPAQAAQGELQGLGLLDGVGFEQLMNGLVAGDKG